MHRLHPQDGDPICYAVLEGAYCVSRHHYAWATRIVVYMQALLVLVIGLATIRRNVVVMMPIVLVMAVSVVLMLALMNMPFHIVGVGMGEKTRKGADGRSTRHGHGRRQGKYKPHRPNQGDAPSACSFQSRQHAFR